MSVLYSKLRPVQSSDDGSWSVYATWYNDDDGQDEGPIGYIEWEVPEWTDLESEAEAMEIIKGYESNSLPLELVPEHPHKHT